MNGLPLKPNPSCFSNINSFPVPSRLSLHNANRRRSRVEPASVFSWLIFRQCGSLVPPSSEWLGRSRFAYRVPGVGLGVGVGVGSAPDPFAFSRSVTFTTPSPFRSKPSVNWLNPSM